MYGAALHEAKKLHFPCKFVYPSCLSQRHSSQGSSAQKFKEWLPNTCVLFGVYSVEIMVSEDYLYDKNLRESC